MQRELNDPSHLRLVYRLPCPECDNTTRHEVLACVEASDSNEDIQYSEEYEIVACLGCEAMSFRKNWHSSDDWEYDDNDSIILADHPEIFPPRRAGRKKLKRDYELPPVIRGIYYEVHQAIANNQRVLAGVGIRALVEAVCSVEGAQGSNLASRIDDLATKNVLTSEAAQVLHGTRLLGNKAAHEVAPPKEEQLEAAMDIAEQLLMNVYILPKMGRSLVAPTLSSKSGKPVPKEPSTDDCSDDKS